jgi:hypothetical protein
MWTVNALFSWVALHVPNKPYDIIINHKHTHIYHQSYHDQHSSYCKDSIEPSQVIATKHFYPKHLFKIVVQGNRDKILVMSLKRWFLSNLCNTTFKYKLSYHASCVGQKIEYAGGEVHLPSLLKHRGFLFFKHLLLFHFN